MSMENFAPLMFGGLILVLLIGFPVAFSLSALGLACGYFRRVDGIVMRVMDCLMAVPTILLAIALTACGISADESPRDIPPGQQVDLGVGDSGAGAQYELKGAKAGNYEAHASIDLGPLRYPSVFIPLNIPVPSKEKKK